jgi:hypothetical protein
MKEKREKRIGKLPASATNSSGLAFPGGIVATMMGRSAALAPTVTCGVLQESNN